MFRRRGESAATCSRLREHISAGIDGEVTSELSTREVRHLEVCRACNDFEQRAAVVTRQLRIRILEPVPDLGDQILSHISAEVHHPMPAHPPRQRRAGRVPPMTRWAAAMIPLALAVSGFSSSAFAESHVAPTHPVTSCTVGLARH
jgi:predicted anti-sigma-YlaC factor YlaD